MNDEIRFWASRLAGESRGSDWIRDFYVCPEEVGELARQIDVPQGGLIGLVGPQGVGKSSALMALYNGLPWTLGAQSERILFKWRRPPQLYDVFINDGNVSQREFLSKYSIRLIDEVLARDLNLRIDSGFKWNLLEAYKLGPSHGMQPDLRPIETRLDKSALSKLRQDAWFDLMDSKHIILIDTPDYSKTDKRRMDADLNDIYWLWNSLVSKGSVATLVVAIQKEMFRGHFFLDKMQKVELKPLSTEQIIDGYARRFSTYEPFTEDAITMLAQMSRGIFRRFLKYLTLTLNLWDSKYRRTQPTIDPAIVIEAVSVEHLTTDMELELTVLFRNSSEQRYLAVKALTLLQEHGEMKQSVLAKHLDAAPHSISRLLTKLENAKYVTRSWDGTDKTVRASSQQS